jgi:hypothetical protein
LWSESSAESIPSSAISLQYFKRCFFFFEYIPHQPFGCSRQRDNFWWRRNQSNKRPAGSMAEAEKPVFVFEGQGPAAQRQKFVQETKMQMSRRVLPMEIASESEYLRVGMLLRPCQVV